jgi:uncharacterized ferritin-like protein (DUF455 family)
MVAFEISAFEAVSRQIAEFPDMPWAFHRDMALQIRDELAHLRMWLERLATRGARIGEFPLSAFEFDMCVERTLGERLALLQRLVEGFALEALDVNRALWEARGDHVMVGYLVRVQADEIMHVRLGNKWLRWLYATEAGVEGVAVAAEAAAWARLRDAASELAASGSVDLENVERLRAKIDYLRMPPIDGDLRRRAGFLEGEIARERAHRDRTGREGS